MSAAAKVATRAAKRHKRERDALVRMVRTLSGQLARIAEGSQRVNVDEAHIEVANILLEKIADADREHARDVRFLARIMKGTK